MIVPRPLVFDNVELPFVAAGFQASRAKMLALQFDITQRTEKAAALIAGDYCPLVAMVKTS